MMDEQQPLIQDGKLNMEIYIRDVIRHRPVYGRTSIKPHEENVVLQDVTYLLAYADQQAAALERLERENAALRHALHVIEINTEGKGLAPHQMEFALEMVNTTAKQALAQQALQGGEGE